jgi:type 1 glutamine amidotransferase
MIRPLLLILFALLAPLCGCSSPAARQPINVLVFTRTAGFRHDSIPAGVEAMRALCDGAGFTLAQSEDPTIFNDAALTGFDVVTFLNTTGDILNDEQQLAFERWFTEAKSFRGFIGIHSAADTEYDWPFYRELIGAQFQSHPPVQQAIVVRDDAAHPATQFLPQRWQRTDEWYNYRTSPRSSGATILLSLDTDSYQGSTMPGDHPIAWCRDAGHSGGGGRMFYTGGGHTIDSFAEPRFRQHLLAALRWAAHDEDD